MAFSSRLLSLALVALSFAPAMGADPAPEGPTITLPTALTGDVGQLVIVKAATNGTVVKWRAKTPGLGMVPAELLKDSLSAGVFAVAAGDYSLEAWTAKGDMPSDLANVTIHFGPVVPPDPTPKPPGPDPPKPPAPTPPAVFRVLITVNKQRANDGAERRGQWSAVQEKEVTDYLRAHCTKDEVLGTAGFRIWDVSVINSVGDDLPFWKQLAAMPRTEDFWIEINDGKGGYHGKLPASKADLLAILKQFGGP